MPFDANLLIDIPLLALLACTAVTVARMRDLWAAAMLTGIYSFLGAGWMLLLDAPDVAFTEAAVGAGISTVLMLGTIALTYREVKPSKRHPLAALTVVSITGAALVYGTLDMPHYGDPNAPIHRHPDPSYIDLQTMTYHEWFLARGLDPSDLTPKEDIALRKLFHEPRTASHQGQTSHAGEVRLDEAQHDDQVHQEKAVEHHMPQNVVTSILASYRGYDTLGETTVIFTAGIAVLMILRGKPARNEEEPAA